MSKQDFLENLKQLLIKKAEGYYYQEEVLEYQQIEQKEANEKNKESCSKSVSSEPEYKNSGVDLNQNKEKTSNAKSRTKQQDKQAKSLVLVKKKVTTHHIPSDMLAIKMLFEIYGKKIESSDSGQDLYSLSDQELYTLKDNLINQLQNIKGGKNENWPMPTQYQMRHSRLF